MNHGRAKTTYIRYILIHRTKHFHIESNVFAADIERECFFSPVSFSYERINKKFNEMTNNIILVQGFLFSSCLFIKTYLQSSICIHINTFKCTVSTFDLFTREHKKILKSHLARAIHLLRRKFDIIICKDFFYLFIYLFIQTYLQSE